MVWRLHFYDTDGIEIGYAEKPDRETYNVVMTHPDSGWDEFKERLELRDMLWPDKEERSLTPPGYTVDTGPMLNRWPPKSHLEEVQKEFSDPKIGSTELKNE